MKEPPYDDSLWPALILFAFTLLFTVAVVLIVYGFSTRVITPPAPSTLPALTLPPG